MSTTTLRGKLLARLAICACIIAVTRATSEMDKVRYGPTKCLNSGITTLLLSAQPYLSPQESGADSANVSVASEIICAFRANKGNALGFTFEDGVCTLYGQGESLEFQQVTFGLPIFPSADDLEEVARLKVTYASPKYYNYAKNLAVDGSISSDASMYHAAVGILNPWWIVDLGEIRTIHQVHIYPRKTCCFTYFHDIEVRVGTTLITDGNLASYKLMSVYEGPYANGKGYVICSSREGVVGKYVSIQRATDETLHYLMIMEVSVYVLKQ